MPSRIPYNPSMDKPLHDSVIRQREHIAGLIAGTMSGLAADCARVMGDRDALERLLLQQMPGIEHCKYLYVLDDTAEQLTANICRQGTDASHFGRDRSQRPYMLGHDPAGTLHLSDAYISINRKRPMLTAIQDIQSADGRIIGYLGADYDLRELPSSDTTSEEPRAYRQLKGDPAIRGNLFLQHRVNSLMDETVDEVIALIVELMTQHGVFHGKLHFSSSRATIWQLDDPFVYRLLDYDDLSNPDLCLAFPHHPYTERACVPEDRVAQVFALIRELRFIDDTIYLRAGSLNVVNGMVGLNFSCDGSHYIPVDEFLDKDVGYWLGGQVIRSTDVDSVKVERGIEQICIRGCNYVESVIDKLEAGDEIGLLSGLSATEARVVLEELRSVMRTYQRDPVVDS